MFNDYDTADSFKKHVKESLKQEINNIATDLALKRENSAYCTPQTKKFLNDEMTTYNRNNSNWRVPAIESVERAFNESSRYYTTKVDERVHGLKLVPPPLAHTVN